MTRRRLILGGAGALVLALVLGAFVTADAGGAPLPVDAAWNHLMISLRADVPLAIAQALDWIGGGWRAVFLVPGVLVGLLLLVRGWRAAAFAVAAFVVSVVFVQLLKSLFDRARPEELLVLSDHGSYPSGHTANAATIALVLWALFPRLWVGVAVIAWTVMMALSRTMLSVHWASDTVGGVLVAASAVLLVAATMLPWVRDAPREQARPVE